MFNKGQNPVIHPRSYAAGINQEMYEKTVHDPNLQYLNDIIYFFYTKINSFCMNSAPPHVKILTPLFREKLPKKLNKF